MSVVPTRDEVPRIVPFSGGKAPRPVMSPSRGAVTGFTGKDFMHMLHRRMWLILICLGIVLTLTAVATWLWRRYAPSYTAQAMLLVNPPKGTDLLNATGDLREDSMNRRMTSYARSIKTAGVLEESLDAIRMTDFYEKAEEDGDFVSALIEEVDVEPIPKTNFLAVSMSGSNRDDVTEIVNAVAAAATKNIQDVSNVDKNARITRLEQERDVQMKLRDTALETIRRLYRSGIGGATLQAEETLSITTQALVTQAMEVRGMYIQALKLLEMINSQTDDELRALPEINNQVEYDPKVRLLEQRLLGLEFELAASEAKLGKDHRSVKDLKVRIATSKAWMEKVEEELFVRAVGNLRTDRDAIFQSIEAQYLTLTEQISKNDEKLKEFRVLTTALIESQKTSERAIAMVSILETQILDMRLLIRGERPVVLYSLARIPTIISFPTWPMMIGVGTMLGLMLGVGLALLLELLDTSIKAPSDVFRRIDLPVLGVIPHLDDVEEDIDDLRTAFVNSSDSIVAEAMHQIRTNLMLSGPATARKSFVVTSPMPEDGRTAVALNVAHCLAGSGKKVLVVDANFRQPMVRNLFPAVPEAGLSNAVASQANWRDLVHEIEPNFFVMSSGPIPPNPADLLESERMRQCIEEFKEDFDHVIFDTAPCLITTEAMGLATQVDGAVLVVRAGVNSYGIVQRTRDNLQRLGTEIFGVVLNGVRASSDGYYRKAYDAFYEYSESQNIPSLPSREANDEA